MPTVCNVTGFLASALVLMTFLMKDMRTLRIIAILSNVAFIAYGALDWLLPVLCLHIVLLPVNICRLNEIRKCGAVNSKSTSFKINPNQGAAVSRG